MSLGQELFALLLLLSGQSSQFLVALDINLRSARVEVIARALVVEPLLVRVVPVKGDGTSGSSGSVRSIQEAGSLIVQVLDQLRGKVVRLPHLSVSGRGQGLTIFVDWGSLDSSLPCGKVFDEMVVELVNFAPCFHFEEVSIAGRVETELLCSLTVTVGVNERSLFPIISVIFTVIN